METASLEIAIEMNRLVEAARREHLNLRAIGGLAVYHHSPRRQQDFRREYADIDFVVPKSERRKLEDFFRRMGYQPDRRFNLLNGDKRQIFHQEGTGRRIDVFVGDFEMCHKLPLKDRLQVHPVTVPLAELFLSKTQIVELNRKDALDLVALLLDHEIGRGDDKINVERICRLCLRDWGLFKTTTINLKRVEDLVNKEELGLTAAERETVLRRIEEIRKALALMKKNILWLARDRLGTRIRWYTEVEEVER
ncbi:MAG: nucleotidyltransferase family protein [Anaerolineales bacterium]|nr:nucleotidyltransferase family protein [Anaerolineales bacterium]MDW8276513.1 hypothetical protein [Anaerolineales bacterium]